MTNDQIKRFLRGGHATFTLESLKTGKHYTFDASLPKDNPNIIWIRVLTDGDKYRYLGTIRIGGESWKYVLTAKSIKGHALHKVLAWFTALLDQDKKASNLVFRHAGRCSRCGRKLTTPESLDAGMGPICSRRVA